MLFVINEPLFIINVFSCVHHHLTCLHVCLAEQLQTNQAAQKAVGELNTVLEWLDGLGQKTHTK